MYYSWLKLNNHLFKDITLDPTLIDDLESISNTDELEENYEESKEDNIGEESEVDTDFLANYFDQEPFNPAK